MDRLKFFFKLLGLGLIGSILLKLCLHHLDPQIIMLSSDEFEHFKYFHRMYQGLLSLDPVLFFSSPGFVYGFGYFALSFFFTWPFLVLKNLSMIILMPKLVSLVFGLLFIWAFYKTLKLYLTEKLSLLMSAFVLTTPFFWTVSSANHPDIMMFFFLVFFLYSLIQKGGALNSSLWKPSASLAAAIGSKFQAIFYYPALVLYIFYEECSSLKFKNFRRHLFLWIQYSMFILMLCMVISPYLFHPLGWKAFIHQIFGTLHDNESKNCIQTPVGKLGLLSGSLFPIFIWIFFLPNLLYQGFLFFKKPKNPAIPILAVSAILNLVYLIFFVNRTNPTYYFGTAVVCLLCFIPILSVARFQKLATFILSMLILGQVVVYGPTYKTIWTEKTLSQEALRISDFVLTSLSRHIHPDTHLLMSLNIGFPYSKLGLDINNTLTIRGPLTPLMIDKAAFDAKWKSTNKTRELKKFYEKDFILIKRNDSAVSSEQLKKLSSGEWGYSLWKESPDLIIFKKTPPPF